jgi:hypothetical protein
MSQIGDVHERCNRASWVMYFEGIINQYRRGTYRLSIGRQVFEREAQLEMRHDSVVNP